MIKIQHKNHTQIGKKAPEDHKAVRRCYGDLGVGSWSLSREPDPSKASPAWKNLSVSHIRLPLLQHCPVCSVLVAAAVASSMRMMALGSAFDWWVIILKSSWSNVNRGVLQRGILLERGVPAKERSNIFRLKILMGPQRKVGAKREDLENIISSKMAIPSRNFLNTMPHIKCVKSDTRWSYTKSNRPFRYEPFVPRFSCHR